jgi:hypothetical protein
MIEKAGENEAPATSVSPMFSAPKTLVRQSYLTIFCESLVRVAEIVDDELRR